LVPDNLKVGVSHASFYDPAINPTAANWPSTSSWAR